MSKPKILVTGATGKTGMPTAFGLLEKGYPVRALVRNIGPRAERLRDSGAEIVVGSLRKLSRSRGRDERRCPHLFLSTA